NSCGCRRRGRRTVRDEDRRGGDWGLPFQSDRTHARATEETDRPAAAARRETRVGDQGGTRRAANLRLPACPRHPQAPSAGRWLKAAQSAAGFPGDEGPRPPARSPCRRRRAARHDGRIAVDERNCRWCSDGFEIGCDNGERVRVAFALDCCDREAMSFLATTNGVN